MNVRETIKEISAYYQTTRQVGHSTLMQVGTNEFNGDKYVLVINRSHGDTLGIKRSEMISLDSLGKLRGANRPLVIDNGVLIEIFDQTVLKYGDLENDAKKERIKFNLAMKDLTQAKREIRTMRNQPFRTFFKTIFSAWPH